jgi:GT2 family glycosyltransferase
LSVLVPVHNSETVLIETVMALSEKFNNDDVEIILIENGSTDNSHAISLELAKQANLINKGPGIKAIRSEKGLGNALKKGISASTGNFILITADDLPFGFDDFDAFKEMTTKPTVTIGSKAHPLSNVKRGFKRQLSSTIFRKLQKLVLQNNIGDTQGTLIVEGNWLREINPRLQSENYLITAEIVQASLVNRRNVIESPVSLRDSHADKNSSVRFSDLWKMAIGQFEIRKNWGVPE